MELDYTARSGRYKWDYRRTTGLWNAEGVHEFQPRAAPWVKMATLRELNAEGVREPSQKGHDSTMAQSLSRIWTHLIFSTKDRFPFLTDETLRRDTHAYLATVLRS